MDSVNIKALGGEQEVRFRNIARYIYHVSGWSLGYLEVLEHIRNEWESYFKAHYSEIRQYMKDHGYIWDNLEDDEHLSVVTTKT